MCQKSIPFHSCVISSWGQSVWKVFLETCCYSSAFSLCLFWGSNALSGLTPASPSRLIWLNCSGKYYSSLWLWPYLPVLYNKHFPYPFLCHSVSPLPLPVTEARPCNVYLWALSPSSILFNRQTLLWPPLPLWSCDSNGLILKCTFTWVVHLHFFYTLGVIPTSLSDLLHFNLLNCSFTSFLNMSAFASASASLPVKCHLGMDISPSPSEVKEKWKEIHLVSLLSVWTICLFTFFCHHFYTTNGAAAELSCGLSAAGEPGVG